MESDILIFADDTSLLVSGNDPFETTSILNRDLARISEWSLKWKVTFNAKKSKDMIFSTKYLNNSPPLYLNNLQIDRVVEHRHFGVIFTNTLDWSPQVNNICLKANKNCLC